MTRLQWDPLVDHIPTCSVDSLDYEPISGFENDSSGNFEKSSLDHDRRRLGGEAGSKPETPPADAPAQQDKVVPSPQDPHDRHWTDDLLIMILAFAALREVFQAGLLRKSLGEIICSEHFRETRARRYPVEPISLSPLLFVKRNGTLYLMGYDNSDTNTWITTPPLPCRLFSSNTKSVAGHTGLLCVFVKEPNEAGVHFAYNPLTQNQRELPYMRFPRVPCVTNLHVTVAENRYQVIAIGSRASGTHPGKTEIYDSKSNEWTEAMDWPEGYFIENQTGVYLEGHLYVIRSRRPYSSRELIILNMANRRWSDPIGLPSPSAFPTTVQLLQCDNKIYVFYQEVVVLEITHCIYRLNHGSEGHTWTKKVNDKFLKKEAFSRAEYTCVPFNKGKQVTKLGIFKNSCIINADNESFCRVYDITEDETEITAPSQCLRSPPFVSENADPIYPENPLGDFLELSFFVDV